MSLELCQKCFLKERFNCPKCWDLTNEEMKPFDDSWELQSLYEELFPLAVRRQHEKTLQDEKAS